MTADLIQALTRINFAASAATIVVFAARGPARRWFGPRLAYALWLLVPLAAGAGLLPGPATGPSVALARVGTDWLSSGGHAAPLAEAWGLGAGACLALAVWRQFRFGAEARAGRAGPAVVGVIQPRMVTPLGYAGTVSDTERKLIRAHELAHIERGDARCNAMATLALWVCWFNPLAHLAMRAMRFDQELACDAMVLASRPQARRAYAEALIRMPSGAASAPFVSPLTGAGHSLEIRLRALAQPARSQLRRDVGGAAIFGLGLLTFGACWVLEPSYPPRGFPAAREREPAILLHVEAASPPLAAWVWRSMPVAPRPRATRR